MCSENGEIPERVRSLIFQLLSCVWLRNKARTFASVSADTLIVHATMYIQRITDWIGKFSNWTLLHLPVLAKGFWLWFTLMTLFIGLPALCTRHYRERKLQWFLCLAGLDHPNIRFLVCCPDLAGPCTFQWWPLHFSFFPVWTALCIVIQIWAKKEKKLHHISHVWILY